jgi:hypothetical protein
MAAAKPGFSADGTFIENPTALLEATIFSLPGAARGANAAKKAPLFNEILNLNETGNLGEYPTKSFQKIPILNLSRVSSSGAGLNCWFDSFLQCMSPKYRSIDINRRSALRDEFRNFIGTTLKESILAQRPSFLTKAPFEVTNEKFISNVLATGTEIEWLNGFLIAWYFGVNLIYVHRDSSGILQIACETSYQSPDCKTIIINHNGNHFEPIGKVVVGADKKLVEGESGSKFLFSWSDKELCNLKELNTMCHGNRHINSIWTQPTACEGVNVSKARAEANKLKPAPAVFNKAQAGEKRANLLERIGNGNLAALNELVEMGKNEINAKKDAISFLSLKNYMTQKSHKNILEKRTDWTQLKPIIDNYIANHEKREGLLKKIKNGNLAALDELVEMGKKEVAAGEEAVTFDSLKPHMDKLKKRTDWGSLEGIFATLKGGRRKRRTMKKRRSTNRKRTLKSKSRRR